MRRILPVLRLAGLLAGPVLLVPAAAAAQVVVGRAVSGLDGSPLAGAVVELLDTAGTRRAAVLTTEDGSFRARAPSPGLYRLALGAMGYRTVTIGPFRLDTDAVVTQRIEAPLEPIRLAELRVAGSARCGEPGNGEALARVWELARRALLAVQITEEAARWGFLIRRREVYMDGRREKTLADTAWTFLQRGPTPFQRASVRRLLRDGFVHIEADTITYFAPDAGLVLSDGFIERHCFRLERNRSGEIGLSFSPERKAKDRSDIEGTLWLDEGSAELRTLDFRYVNPPLGYQWVRPRGELAFRRLPDGGWIVDRWWVMFDRPVARRGELTRRMAGVHVSSGHVLEARPPRP